MQKFQGMLAPMKLMTQMIKDPKIEQMVATIEVFVNSVSSLLSVFSGYGGGDFCAGLIFGVHGSKMLTHIATMAFEMGHMSPQDRA